MKEIVCIFLGGVAGIGIGIGIIWAFYGAFVIPGGWFGGDE